MNQAGVSRPKSEPAYNSALAFAASEIASPPGRLLIEAEKTVNIYKGFC